MKRFDICVIDDQVEEFNEISMVTGEITVGDYKETFLIPIDSWSIEEYENQWKESLLKIVDAPSSCLVAAFRNLSLGPVMDLFVLYKVGDLIYIQNYMPGFFPVESDKEDKIEETSYNGEPCYQFIKPRRVNDKGDGVNEDGQPLWEKKISLKDFMESLPITA